MPVIEFSNSKKINSCVYPEFITYQSVFFPPVLSLEISKKCLAMLPLPPPIRLLFSSYFSMLQLVKISCTYKNGQHTLGSLWSEIWP